MRSVTKQRKGFGELEESTYVSRPKRSQPPLQGHLAPWKRQKPRIVGAKSAWALDTGGRNVKIGSELCLERFQAQRGSTQMGNPGLDQVLGCFKNPNGIPRVPHSAEHGSCQYR